MNLKLYIRNELFNLMKRIPRIQYQLNKIYYRKTHQFGKQFFYQSYPPLNIRGERPTLNRYATYQLKKYLKKNMNILDIGGNTGFFSLYISRFVKSINILEMDKSLIKVGEKLRQYEKISNVRFTCSDIMNYIPDIQYDMLFSLAVHDWVDMPFDKYIMHISSMLKPKGILLIESQDILKDDIQRKIDSVKHLFKVIEKGETDDHMGLQRKFYFLTRKK